MECISTWDELRDFNKVGSPFSIPKAALALAGFIPEFSAGCYVSLEEQLKAFGCGLEVTLLAAIPAGPGNQFDSCGYGIGCIVGFLWLGVG